MWDELARKTVEGVIQGILSRRDRSDSTPPEVVEASHFVLRDDQGRGRAILAMADGAPCLFFLDEKEEVRITLCAEEQESHLRLFGRDGQSEALLRVDEGGPDLSLIDRKGAVRSTLRLESEGPDLTFFDRKGNVRASLKLDPDGSTLSLSDRKGIVRAEVSLDGEGPSVILRDGEGEVGAELRPAVPEEDGEDGD